MIVVVRAANQEAPMSPSNRPVPYASAIWTWAREFGHRLTGHAFPTFFLALGGSDHPTTVVCGVPRAGAESLVIPADVLRRLEGTPSWIHFAPVGGPEDQFVSWHAVDRKTMERIVGVPLSVSPPDEFPVTKTLRF